MGISYHRKQNRMELQAKNYLQQDAYISTYNISAWASNTFIYLFILKLNYKITINKYERLWSDIHVHLFIDERNNRYMYIIDKFQHRGTLHVTNKLAVNKNYWVEALIIYTVCLVCSFNPSSNALNKCCFFFNYKLQMVHSYSFF